MTSSIEQITLILGNLFNATSHVLAHPGQPIPTGALNDPHVSLRHRPHHRLDVPDLQLVTGPCRDPSGRAGLLCRAAQAPRRLQRPALQGRPRGQAEEGRAGLLHRAAQAPRRLQRPALSEQAADRQ